MNTRAQASLCFASRASARPSGTPGQLPGGWTSSSVLPAFSFMATAPSLAGGASRPARFAVKPGTIQEGA